MATVASTGTIPRDRRWTVVRAGLVLLGVGQGIAAVWALAAPRSFFEDFPGGGMAWVAAEPPYNEHLVVDYGASFLALAVLALVAATLAGGTLVRVALGVWVVAAVPHLVFHATHTDGLAGADLAAQLVTLALNAGVPLVLLALVPKEEPR